MNLRGLFVKTPLEVELLATREQRDQFAKQLQLATQEIEKGLDLMRKMIESHKELQAAALRLKEENALLRRALSQVAPQGLPS